MSKSALEDLFLALPKLHSHHSRDSAVYPFLEKVARLEIETLFSAPEGEQKPLLPFGPIVFPYFKMGAIDSLDLFGLDELILFSFYWANRKRYRSALDIGANIGLHSLLLAKCGFHVSLFEPDPIHFEKLQEVLRLNRVADAKAHQAAISNRSGSAEFVRVLGNTTSSHLAGAKRPYGQLERFHVPLFHIRDAIASIDLMKMDVEGHEREILLATEERHWEKMDGFVEIGSPENAQAVFEHFSSTRVNLFSQKIGWQKVKSLKEMPSSYKEGSVFITSKEAMSWEEG